MTVRHYLVCDSCGLEHPIPRPNHIPPSFGKTMDPSTNTPLEVCGGCSDAIHAMLRRRGWVPPKTAEDSD